MENYLVVLFKNKVRYKILKKYITYKNAKNYFSSIVEKNKEIIFDKKIINGKESKFEVGLIEKSSKQLLPVYMTDEFGRNIKVKIDDDSLTLIEINEFKEEELLYDIQQNKKITVPELIKKYLKYEGVKMISSLNNKIVIQNEDKYFLFSLKNDDESKRFIDCLTSHFHKNRRGDCIFVKDTSSAQKKYLYDVLSKNGFEKKILYRKFTTFPQSYPQTK